MPRIPAHPLELHAVMPLSTLLCTVLLPLPQQPQGCATMHQQPQELYIVHIAAMLSSAGLGGDGGGGDT